MPSSQNTSPESEKVSTKLEPLCGRERGEGRAGARGPRRARFWRDGVRVRRRNADPAERERTLYSEELWEFWHALEDDFRTLVVLEW